MQHLVAGYGGITMSGTLVFGIDGGGSVSRLRVAGKDDPLTSLVTVHGGSTNLFSVTSETAADNVWNLIDEACGALGVQASDLAAGCMGSAGLGRPEEQSFFHELFSRMLPHTRMKLCNDGEILLVGGVRSLEGYCLIAGTGSFAMARAQDGTSVRAGGYGYMLGDEGSAWWIADQAVKRTIRSSEGRDLSTEMAPSLLAFFGLERLDGFVQLFHHQYEKSRVAKAAKIVTEFARLEDPLARDILRDASGELVGLVRSIYRRMPLSDPRLVLAGGVLDNDPVVRPLFLSLLAREIPGMRIVSDAGSALDGACMLAAELAQPAEGG